MSLSYLYDHRAFDPESTKAMGRAFESVRRLRPNASPQLIANRIIQLAKNGQRDADTLCATIVNELRERMGCSLLLLHRGCGPGAGA